MASKHIDHDRLFKELFTTFFVEFLELFFPQVVSFIDARSLTFLDKEVFTDVTAGKKHVVDLIARLRFAGEERFFLLHVEPQAKTKTSPAGCSSTLPGFTRSSRFLSTQ